MPTQEERHARERLIYDAVGGELWLSRDPVLMAVARLYVEQKKFRLVDCLADMVRHQTTAKNQAHAVAVDRARKGT